MPSQRNIKIHGGLPDFIVIGAMKAGTTSLQAYLAAHPQIGMATKEINFFSKDENWQRGIEWYRQHFNLHGQVFGEISPGYSKRHLHPQVPERIHSVIPNVKLIYVLREPISRVISHFSHSIGEDYGNRSPETIFDDYAESFIDTSRYYYQLEHYLEFFDIGKILIVTTENLKTCRRETLQVIFRFLGVDDSFSSPEFEEIRHDSSVKVKRNLVGRTLSRFSLLKKLEDLGKAVVPLRWHRYFAQAMGTKFDRPILLPEQLERINGPIQVDLRNLKGLTGREFDEWG